MFVEYFPDARCSPGPTRGKKRLRLIDMAGRNQKRVWRETDREEAKDGEVFIDLLVRKGRLS